MERSPTPSRRAGQSDGLRARKRAQTERRIQAAALELFDRRSFDEVTVEQVAEAAEVSVATVYRYFVTKENLVLHDPVEALLTDSMIEALRAGIEIPAALVRVLESLPAELGEGLDEETRIRIRLANEVPAIAGAAHIRARARAAQLVDALPSRAADPLRARVQALAALSALEAATDHWHDDPHAGTLRDVTLSAVRALPGPP
jgi:AcrR family transcriptional regulator